MSRLIVRLPADRNYLGSLTVVTVEESTLAGPFEVSGRADDVAAAQHDNANRNPLLPFGDTPLGVYRVTEIVASGQATEFPSDSFGPNGVVVLEPVSGEAALADANGRFRILIQGGSPAPGGCLRTTNGSLRLADDDQKELVNRLRAAGAIDCYCIAGEITPLSRMVATQAACTDGDPNPCLNAHSTQLEPAPSALDGDIESAVVRSGRLWFAPRAVFHTLRADGDDVRYFPGREESTEGLLTDPGRLRAQRFKLALSRSVSESYGEYSDHAHALSIPVRVSFVVGTFTFGGSETETIELVLGADRRKLEFRAIAVMHPLPLPQGEPPRDGNFPPIYLPASQHSDVNDPRVRIVEDFKTAVRHAIKDVDVVISWGIRNLQDYLPAGRLPRFVIMSKDSGEWARGFLYPNSFLTRHHIANSTLAASAFPENVRADVKVIHNGINPCRIVVKTGRSDQRRAWGLADDDKVVGYLGRIERDKGMGKVVRGVNVLPAEWKAVFIGMNPNCGYGRELAADCERFIPGRFRLLPWCHDIGSALAAMDVFAHPSDHEGFSNSIGEAWLAGIPTVYTADTGVIPDLGDLGVPVPHELNAEEMAGAILRAHGDRFLAAHAQQVMMGNYLVEHNVQRWTDYLLSLHGSPRKFRVLVTSPESQLCGEAAELCSLLQPHNDLDFCRLVAVADQHQANLDLLSQLAADCHCPLTYVVPSTNELNKIVHLVHPDILLYLGPPTFDRLVREGHAVPVIHIRSASSAIDGHRSQALTKLVMNLVH